MEVIYLDAEMIVMIHDQILKETSGLPGIRYDGAVDSCAAQPRQSFSGHEFFTTIHEKAAALAYYIATGHPFVDGNKRTAYESMRVFLIINHWNLNTTDEESIAVMLNLAERKIGKEAMAEWVKQRLVELPREPGNRSCCE